MWHRAWECEAAAFHRHTLDIPAEFGAMARREGSTPFWSHALLPDPSVGLPLPEIELRVEWQVPSLTGFFEGHGYGDGSGIKATYPRQARCGWGVATVELADGITHWVSGAICRPLPGPLQTVPFAESFALLMYLRHFGDGEPVFLTDCLWVKRSFEKGPGGTTGAMHCYAETWRAIRAKIEDLCGRSAVTVRKVKAHSTRRQLAAGAVDGADKFGNDKADMFAKQGARMHLFDDAAEARIVRTEKATTTAGNYLAKIHLFASKAAIDTTPRAQRRGKKGIVKTAHLRRAKPGQRHTVVFNAQRARCTSCWRSARTKASLDSRPCTPGAAHSLFVRGEVVQCWKCACYSSGAAINLLKPCKGVPWSKNSHDYRALLAARRGRCPKTRSHAGAWLPLSSAFLNCEEAKCLMAATRRLRNKTRW